MEALNGMDKKDVQEMFLSFEILRRDVWKK